MTTEVIREFLVSLGFQTKETELKKFEKGIDNATKAAMKLGSELAAVAAAAAAAVAVVGSKFEDLYYSSQRINSTVDNIRGFGFAIGQMGGNAKNAQGALEGLASFMRTNPGGERFITSLGVQTRETNGDMRDTTAIMLDLGKAFKAMPYYMAKTRANMLGIDEQTLQALMRGDIQKNLDAYGRIAKRVGMDQQQAAEASKDFMNRLRELGLYLTLLGEKFLVAIQKPIERLMDLFTALDGSSGGLTTAIIGVTAVLVPLAALVGPVAAGIAAVAAAVVLLTDDFMQWREGGKSLIDWSKWSDEIDAAVAGLGSVWDAIKEVWSAFGDLGKAIGLDGDFIEKYVRSSLTILSGGLRDVAYLIRFILDLLTGKWGAAWQEAAKFGTDSMSNWMKVLGIWTGDDKEKGNGPSAQARREAIARHAANDNAGAGVAGGSRLHQTSAAINARVGEALAYFQRKGWSRAQAAGIVANLKGESAMDPNAMGDGGAASGLGQWHRDRQEAFRRWAGKRLQDATFAEQLGFVHYELTGGGEQNAGRLLRGATHANDAGRIVAKYYERPKDTEGAMRDRGSEAASLFDNTRLGVSGGSGNGTPQGGPHGGTVVHIKQETNIKVDGAGDPAATGRATAGEQARVNGQLLRNAQGALR